MSRARAISHLLCIVVIGGALAPSRAAFADHDGDVPKARVYDGHPDKAGQISRGEELAPVTKKPRKGAPKLASGDPSAKNPANRDKENKRIAELQAKGNGMTYAEKQELAQLNSGKSVFCAQTMARFADKNYDLVPVPEELKAAADACHAPNASDRYAQQAMKLAAPAAAMKPEEHNQLVAELAAYRDGASDEVAKVAGKLTRNDRSLKADELNAYNLFKLQRAQGAAAAAIDPGPSAGSTAAESPAKTPPSSANGADGEVGHFN
jgi:hypothetical protein